MNVTIAEVLEMEPAMRRDPRMTMERATRRNKVEVKRTDEDDPARAAFVDELRAKRVAANA